MTLNPGLLNPYQDYNPFQGVNPSQNSFGAAGQFGQPAGIGSVLSANGNTGLNFGQGNNQQQFGQQGYAGSNVSAHAQSTIEDIADDIAERVADDIADQAATGASALYQAQVPHAAGQSVGGLNIKRWLNATRVTDGVRESIKQNAHQLARQAVGHLLNVIQTHWAGAGQQHQQGQHQQGQHQQGQQQFGQLGGFQAPGLAAYGAGSPGLGQQNIAQLAPVVAAILGILQTQGQGQQGQGFGQASHGGSGRLI